MDPYLSTECLRKIFTASIRNEGPKRMPGELRESVRRSVHDKAIVIVRLWIACGGDAAANDNKVTLLSIAAYQRHADTVRFLLGNGANVMDHPDNRRGLYVAPGENSATSALVSCCVNNKVSTPAQLETAKVLLNAGANIDAIYRSFGPGGNTPLMLATLMGNRRMVHYLLHRGAQNVMVDVVQSPAARSPAVLAHELGYHDLKCLFDAVFLRAGSYKAYVREPRVRLLLLRVLCERLRATPPADGVLGRVMPLPREVFWLVMQYWSPNLAECWRED